MRYREIISYPDMVQREGIALQKGMNFRVRGIAEQTAYFERPTSYAGPHPVILDATTALYTRSHGDAKILGGGADETGASPSDPDQYDERADPEFPGAVSARLGRRLLRRDPAGDPGAADRP